MSWAKELCNSAVGVARWRSSYPMLIFARRGPSSRKTSLRNDFTFVAQRRRENGAKYLHDGRLICRARFDVGTILCDGKFRLRDTFASLRDDTFFPSRKNHYKMILLSSRKEGEKMAPNTCATDV
ncbi:unnamed protein product [Prunus armeniaca]